MILALDIGNTNIVIGYLESEENIVFVERLSTDLGKTSLEYAISIKNSISRNLIIFTSTIFCCIPTLKFVSCTLIRGRKFSQFAFFICCLSASCRSIIVV